MGGSSVIFWVIVAVIGWFVYNVLRGYRTGARSDTATS